MKTVLLVDDSAVMLSLLQTMLADVYRLRVAINGVKALGIAAMQKPDLVILDLHMPGMDGHEVLLKLKTNPATAPIPVVLMSGTRTEQDEARAREGGAAAFLAKPIEPEALRALLARLLNPA
jgi:putative two-component system response regulator